MVFLRHPRLSEVGKGKALYYKSKLLESINKR